jgi:hypothetical protein
MPAAEPAVFAVIFLECVKSSSRRSDILFIVVALRDEAFLGRLCDKGVASRDDEVKLRFGCCNGIWFEDLSARTVLIRIIDSTIGFLNLRTLLYSFMTLSYSRRSRVGIWCSSWFFSIDSRCSQSFCWVRFDGNDADDIELVPTAVP